ncbi:histidinol-phosphate transaminase [Lautropia dentalis]|uniref:Histidinol-phosphate aminotransferase n=1 Tax=Lautropia dentalis TaxID=2490857 RepID=A0A426FQW6_9BURK|nr:histidinol-phosphate transaminase [Lautropia dentalis]RRN45041.1 histidinol-phosphate transaminase [Lautropia dentalis]
MTTHGQGVSPADGASAGVKGLAPYKPGRPIGEVARELGLDPAGIVKLASNENPLGMSPKSVAAVQQVLAVGDARYPDANGHDLKQALAAHYGIDAGWITLGNGSNDVLELAARALVGPGQRIVYSRYAFVVYPLVAKAIGAVGVEVPDDGLGHDLDAMLAAITPDTRLVFLANPNNPTGTFIEGERLLRFLEQVPPQVAVVLDEAYTEYLRPEQRYDALAWVKRLPNLIVSRTFSKAFGLAGLRVGFAVAQPAITDLLGRVRQPFNVNTLALVAAQAVLADADYQQRSYALNQQGLKQLSAAFDALGLTYVPSSGNFVLVKVGDAAAVNDALLRAGVIVRPVANYGLPEWLRISVGLPEENQKLIDALTKILKG